MRNIFLLIFISLTSIGQIREAKQSDFETDRKFIQLQNLDGVYEYIYTHNTPGLIENQYIVLKNGTGLYYGTSDEFDEAREGYLPGFFVADMQNLRVNKNNISFKLKITLADLFMKPIPIKFKSSIATRKAGHKRWEEAKIQLEERYYEGIIKGNTLYFKSEVSGFDKVFIRKK